jgi:hypothetical protein
MQHASAANVCSLRIIEALFSVYKASLYAFQVAYLKYEPERTRLWGPLSLRAVSRGLELLTSR